MQFSPRAEGRKSTLQAEKKRKTKDKDNDKNILFISYYCRFALVFIVFIKRFLFLKNVVQENF